MTLDEIKTLLAAQPPELQGVILADLTAIWLAGHVIPGDVYATRGLQAEILAAHIERIEGLIYDK